MLDTTQTQYILDNYSKIKDCVEIAKNLGVSPYYVRNTLKKNNVSLFNQSIIQRKYKIDDKYFDIIDNEHKAYWLGLLYADGTLSSKNNSVRLELQIGDKIIIDNFRKDLCSTHPIKITKLSNKNIRWQDTCKLSFANMYLYNSLTKHGCYPNKTFTLKFPTQEQVPEYLIPHFIRGYFDGDGCLTLYKYNGYDKNTLQIDSTKNMCDGINKYLNKFNIFSHIYTPKKARLTSKQLVIRRRLDCYQTGLLMYNTATIFFPRKLQKFLLLENSLFEKGVITHKQLNLSNLEKLLQQS